MTSPNLKSSYLVHITHHVVVGECKCPVRRGFITFRLIPKEEYMTPIRNWIDSTADSFERMRYTNVIMECTHNEMAFILWSWNWNFYGGGRALAIEEDPLCDHCIEGMNLALDCRHCPIDIAESFNVGTSSHPFYIFRCPHADTHTCEPEREEPSVPTVYSDISSDESSDEDDEGPSCSKVARTEVNDPCTSMST